MASLTPEQLAVPSDYFDMRILQLAQIAGSLEVARGMHAHKVAYAIGEDSPSPIDELAGVVTETFGQPFNTAVVKSYNNGDGIWSGAYSPHLDPERYKGIFSIVSLNNRAVLSARLVGRINTLNCIRGTAVALSTEVEHAVTPPLEGDVRYAVFFAFDVTKSDN